MLPEAVLLGAVIFGPLAFGATEFWSVSILEGLLFALAVLCATRGVFKWDHPIYKTVLPAVLVPCGVLVLAGLLLLTLRARKARGQTVVDAQAHGDANNAPDVERSSPLLPGSPAGQTARRGGMFSWMFPATRVAAEPTSAAR